MSGEKIEAKRVSGEKETALYDVFINGAKVMNSVTYDCFLQYLSNIHEVPDDER